MMTGVLARTLEPEVMDTAEDSEEYDAMDFGEANDAFARDALRLVERIAQPRVVDLGAGTADIPVRMLAMRADLRVVAVDLAVSMLDIARRKAAAAGIADRLELIRDDVKGTELAAGSFDLVMSNSTAHHIPAPLLLFREVRRLVADGGAFIVRDLVRPRTLDEAHATVARVAPGASERQQKLFCDSLCAALTIDEVRRMGSEAGLLPARIEIVSDRHWTLERPAGRR